MKFIDEAKITIQSGDGGSGCVSFRREKFIPRGGPDGGDGGKGGDVILKSSPRKRTLYDFRYKRHLKAKNGAGGQGKKKAGKKGDDIIVEVPAGTVVTDSETGKTLKDFISPGETIVAAVGGRGGQGNYHFKSATRRIPRFAQPGEPGQTIQLKLELKLIADVGLIGLPNAGKSTLISKISAAKPKIGSYPFTTLVPNLGVVYTDWGEPFVVADIPGLIEGAHEGAGLGTQFLRHIERTRILVHLIDVSTLEPDNILSSYITVNHELEKHNQQLSNRKQLLVLNKMDTDGSEENARRFKEAIGDIDVVSISALAGTDIDILLSRILDRLERS
ncbi:MAG: GTPase ObgE [Desulfobacterales bacterium]|nr:GTPase ObgE [Desulfobacterales bacterium]MDX2512576.1 GTPase ObgE [Desulfobacterales bacterium]